MNQPFFPFEENLEEYLGNMSINTSQNSEECLEYFEPKIEDEETENKIDENLDEETLDGQQKVLKKKILQKQLRIAQLKSAM